MGRLDLPIKTPPSDRGGVNYLEGRIPFPLERNVRLDVCAVHSFLGVAFQQLLSSSFVLLIRHGFLRRFLLYRRVYKRLPCL